MHEYFSVWKRFLQAQLTLFVNVHMMKWPFMRSQAVINYSSWTFRRSHQTKWQRLFLRRNWFHVFYVDGASLFTGISQLQIVKNRKFLKKHNVEIFGIPLLNDTFNAIGDSKHDAIRITELNK